MEILGQQEQAPGGDCRERDFDEVIFRASGEQQRQGRHHRAARYSADDGGDQQTRGRERRGRVAAGEGEDHGESHRSRTVIEQGFAFHQQEQTSAGPACGTWQLPRRDR